MDQETEGGALKGLRLVTLTRGPEGFGFHMYTNRQLKVYCCGHSKRKCRIYLSRRSVSIYLVRSDVIPKAIVMTESVESGYDLAVFVCPDSPYRTLVALAKS